MTLGQNGVLRYGHFCGFLEAKLVNLSPIDFLLGLPLDINANDGQNKFEIHISINMERITNYQPKIGQDATLIEHNSAIFVRF